MASPEDRQKMADEAAYNIAWGIAGLLRLTPGQDAYPQFQQEAAGMLRNGIAQALQYLKE